MSKISYNDEKYQSQYQSQSQNDEAPSESVLPSDTMLPSETALPSETVSEPVLKKGKKMLEMMGWETGKSLATNDGIALVKPLDVKIRPVGLGLGYNNFSEKTQYELFLERTLEHARGVKSTIDQSDESDQSESDQFMVTSSLVQSIEGRERIIRERVKRICLEDERMERLRVVMEGGEEEARVLEDRRREVEELRRDVRGLEGSVEPRALVQVLARVRERCNGVQDELFTDYDFLSIVLYQLRLQLAEAPPYDVIRRWREVRVCEYEVERALEEFGVRRMRLEDYHSGMRAVMGESLFRVYMDDVFYPQLQAWIARDFDPKSDVPYLASIRETLNPHLYRLICRKVAQEFATLNEPVACLKALRDVIEDRDIYLNLLRETVDVFADIDRRVDAEISTWDSAPPPHSVLADLEEWLDDATVLVIDAKVMSRVFDKLRAFIKWVQWEKAEAFYWHWRKRTPHAVISCHRILLRFMQFLKCLDMRRDMVITPPFGAPPGVNSSTSSTPATAAVPLKYLSLKERIENLALRRGIHFSPCIGNNYFRFADTIISFEKNTYLYSPIHHRPIHLSELLPDLG